MNKITVNKVLKRDNGKCVLDGRTPVSLHHIVYKSHGGTDDERNLICLCSHCHIEVVHADEKYWRDRLIERQRGYYGYFEIKDVKKRNKWEAIFNE